MKLPPLFLVESISCDDLKSVSVYVSVSDVRDVRVGRLSEYFEVLDDDENKVQDGC